MRQKTISFMREGDVKKRFGKLFTLLFFIFVIYIVTSKTKNEVTDSTATPPGNQIDIIAPIPTPALQSISPKGIFYPSNVLNLTNWKITLPTGSAENPTEIKQPELTTYSIDPWFIVMPGGVGVRFRAAVNGATTDGSDYPRSELREMTNNGTKKASWSSRKGTHTMFLDQAITAVPKIKPHIVAGQIHDDNKDIIMIRLDYPNLHIRIDGKNLHTLDPYYTLGKRFTIKFVVSDGMTKVYYNNSPSPVYTLSKKYSDAYFKTGAYTQSNCSREGSPSLCNNDNYGEVIVYQATVTHQ